MIRIVGLSDKDDENKAALQLRDTFLRWRPELEHNKEQVLILVAVQALGSRGNQDIDLVVLTRFTRPLTVDWRFPDEATIRQVPVWSFCATIEVKGHEVQRPDGTVSVRFRDNQVDVLYRNEWHNATLQALGQGKSFKTRLYNELGVNFYLVSFVLLFRVTKEQIKNHVNEPNAILPHSFTIGEFAKKLLDLDKPRFDRQGNLSYAIWVKELDFDVVAKRLTSTYQATSLDRSKIDAVLKRRIDFKQFELLGKQQQIVSGPAGSGKTIVLLRVAIDFYRMGKRVSLLTYNKCLVADISRLLMIMKVTGPSYDANIRIMTLHSYFVAIIKVVFPGEEVTSGDWFADLYVTRLREVVAYLKEGAATREDIKSKLLAQDFPVFDIACVDEGQDWLDSERDLLHYMIGSENCIIASGFDQLIRQDSVCDWSAGDLIATGVTRLKTCLRMKSSLAAFANVVAAQLGLGDWEVQPDDDVVGGNIVLVTGSFSDYKSLNEKLIATNRSAGNENIDMLYCVDSSNMLRVEGHATGSVLASQLGAHGFKVWDATVDENRSDPPRTTDHLRVVQYDSCRGLEGWIVVAEHLDIFFQSKVATHRSPLTREISFLHDPLMDAKLAAARSAMIPLTRAIDTMVISIRNPKSVFGQAALAAAARLPDIVTLYE